MRSPFDRGAALWSTIVAVAVACGAPSHPPRAASDDLADGFGATDALRAWVRRCALIVGCSDVHDSSQFRDPATCVDWWLVNRHDEAPLVDCLARASSCGDVHACTHERSDPGAAAFCAAHPTTFSACEGNKVYDCQGDDGQESVVVDCAALAGKCVEHAQGGLVVRGCESPALCPPNAPERRCDGDAIVNCEGSLVEKRTCPLGTRCAARKDENGAPTAQCEGSASPPCTPPFGARCDGDVAVVCVQNGRFPGSRHTDCASYGMRCEQRDGRANCVSRAPQCTPSPPSCQGDSLTFCAAGEPRSVSCRGMGLAACAPDAKGPGASCRVAP